MKISEKLYPFFLQILKWFAVIASAALIVFAFFLIFKIYSAFNGAIFPLADRAEWGQLGDYFGGTLNPIFSFLSFIALLVTVFYQAKSLKVSSDELRLSTEELRNSATALKAQNQAIQLQSFEQTFFAWLNSYHSLLNSTSSRMFGQHYSGKEYLHQLWMNNLAPHMLWQELITPDNKYFNDIEFKSLDPNMMRKDGIEIALSTLHNERPSLIISKINQSWQQLYNSYAFQLDSLFRTLYRLILWIDSQNSLSQAQKWAYVTIIRSQLSWIEMVLLYYNCLTKKGVKFKYLIEKYALFDNLTFESNICCQLLQKSLMYPEGYSPEAFSSNLARVKLALPESSDTTLEEASVVLFSRSK